MAAAATHAACNMTFDPPADPTVFVVEEQSSRILTYTISCLEAGYRAIQIIPKDGTIAAVLPTEIRDMFNASVAQSYNTSVTGLAFGWTDLLFQIDNGTRDEEALGAVAAVYHVTVFRKPTSINLVFQIVLGIMILLYNFGFGCKVQHEHIRDILRRPVAPAIGAACQFLVMAPLSFGIAQAVSLEDMTGLGLLAIGCSPGGGGSNVFAYLLDADLELSITLTFISTILALAMTPFWMWALGRYFYTNNSRLHIPIANVFSSLAIVVFPVAAGCILRHFRPTAADKIAWTLKPFTAVIGVTFIGLGVYVYYYALVRITWRLLVACAVMSLCGYAIGGAAGYVGRQGRKRTATIALETGFQNLALALFMINTSLDPPESDFAGVVPICYSFISSVYPTAAFLVLHAVRGVQRLRGSQRAEDMFKVTDTSADSADTADDLGESNRLDVYTIREPI